MVYFNFLHRPWLENWLGIYYVTIVVASMIFRIWDRFELGESPKFPFIIIIGNILEMAKSQNDDKE